MKYASCLLSLATVIGLNLSSVADARPILRVGMIPDVNPSRIIRDSRPLVEALERKTGTKVMLTVPTNYAAVVEALANNQLDVAYLGGFTYLQAHRRAGVVPLVQRESDRHFHALFITQTHSSIKRLQDLKGHTFAFGDVNSTSGHLMPAYFLRQCGLSPDTSFKQVVFTGGHDATALAVANGKVDAGAIDETVFHKLLEKGVIRPSEVRVFYTTPPFLDYVWVARKGLDRSIQATLVETFLGWSQKNPHDKALLDLLRGTYFVKATPAEYRQLEQAATDEHLLK